MEIPRRRLRRRLVHHDMLLDEQQQETLIKNFTSKAAAQSKFYRLAFSIVLAVPSPAFVFAKQCRTKPKLSVLCLVSILTSAYTLRSRGSRAVMLRKLNIVLAAVLALQAWASSQEWSRTDSIWLFPLMGAITTVLLEHWISQVDREIINLTKSKYDLRGA